MPTPKRLWLGLWLLLLAGLGACSGGEADAENPAASSAYAVEAIFNEFYTFLGGEERLGPALSPVIYEGSSQKQYVEAGLMVYDPDLPPSERYSLSPIGASLGVWDEPLTNPDLPGVLFVEGYIIYEGFAPLYEEMGGQRYVGLPLTGVRYLEAQNRVEQYFENLGFFINLDGDAGVQLMNYGQVACGGSCGAANAPAAIIQIELPYGEPFTSTVSRLGDGFVGARLAGPYQTADGSIEVIYANLVLYAHPDNSTQAAPRPILGLLGVAPEPMTTRLDNANLMFYGLSGDLGYNVPLVFTAYIEQHGGFEIFGQPISEFRVLEDGGFRQCFANACLRYVADGHVEPLPMGAEYKAAYYDQPVPQLGGDQVIQIQVWEEHSQVNSSEEQIIHATLFSGTQLLEGLRPYLDLSLPGGGSSVYQFPPSDADGHTQVTVPAVAAQNGTLVPYQVCLEGLEIERVCASESYMIWGNP